MTTSRILVSMSWADATIDWAPHAHGLDAHIAHLQGGDPNRGLTTVLSACAHSNRIILIPCTHDHSVGVSWVKRVARWWLHTTDWGGELYITGVGSDVPEVSDISECRRITCTNPETLTNPAWQDPPPVAKHIIVCQGVRCLAKGADEALRELHDALDAADLLDTHVLVTRSACLYPCNRAPVMCVQPDMKWVGPVTSDTIDDVMRLVRGTGGRRNACGYEPGRS